MSHHKILMIFFFALVFISPAKCSSHKTPFRLLPLERKCTWNLVKAMKGVKPWQASFNSTFTHSPFIELFFFNFKKEFGALRDDSGKISLFSTMICEKIKKASKMNESRNVEVATEEDWFNFLILFRWIIWFIAWVTGRQQGVKTYRTIINR